MSAVPYDFRLNSSKAGAKEIREMHIHGYVKWQYTTAVRSNTPWQNAIDPPPSLMDLRDTMGGRLIDLPFVSVVA